MTQDHSDTEQRLRWLSKVFMEAADPILIEDLDGILIDANCAAESAYGWKREELIGKSICTIVPAERHEQAGELLARCKNGEAVRNVEGLRWTREKEIIPVLLTLSLLKDDEGQPAAIASLAKDISELKQAERALVEHRDLLERTVHERTAALEARNEELTAAKSEAESANRAKSAFLANMSHELRTPMNAIIGYSEMLAEDMEDADDADPEILEDVKRIHAAGKHLLSLINDVLDLSKIEAGRMDLFLERFDLQKMLTESVSTIAPLMQKNDITFETRFEADIGTIRADLTKLRQTLFNLLSNAAKFSQGGTVVLAAERWQKDDEPWIRLSISDTGIGIPTDKLEAVFEEFSQADSSTTRRFGGTGLGLPISRRFSRMMGGDVQAESVEGEGSVFTIEIPATVDALEAARSAAEDLAAADGTQIAQESQAPTQPEGDPNAPLVLIIDDDDDCRQLIGRTLRREGFQTVMAPSGSFGLELADSLRPALITLDVMMPEMDGWTVLRSLRANPELASIPVLMVSILAQQEMGYALGAHAYLTKPLDRSKLIGVMHEFGVREGGRVLVIDDDENVRTVLGRALRRNGHEMIEAANGREGLERYEQMRLDEQAEPDLILLDLMMPVMDGFEFVQRLRATERDCRVPIIVMTSKTLTDTEQQFLTERVEAVLQKPERVPETIINEVHRILGNAQ